MGPAPGHTAASVVATFRSREWVPEPIAQLWRSGLLELWELGTLDRTAMADVARDVCGHPLDPPVLDRLWALTRGNALFLHTLLRSSIAAGSALSVADIDRHLNESGTVLDFVEARLGGSARPRATRSSPSRSASPSASTR